MYYVCRYTYIFGNAKPQRGVPTNRVQAAPAGRQQTTPQDERQKARTPIALSSGARPAEARNAEQWPESEVSEQQRRPRRRAEGRERKPRQQHWRRRTRRTQEEGQRPSQARATGGSGRREGGRRGRKGWGGITSAEERGGRRRQETRGTGALEDGIDSSKSGACCARVSGQDKHEGAGRVVSWSSCDRGGKH